MAAQHAARHARLAREETSPFEAGGTASGEPHSPTNLSTCLSRRGPRKASDITSRCSAHARMHLFCSLSVSIALLVQAETGVRCVQGMDSEASKLDSCAEGHRPSVSQDDLGRGGEEAPRRAGNNVARA